MNKFVLQFKDVAQKKLPMVLLGMALLSCSEQPLIGTPTSTGLNSPASISLIPGTSCAIVANANINIDQEFGSLIVVDLQNKELLIDTKFDIPNFAGDIYIDGFRSKVYVPDHDESLLIYKYEISGTNCSSVTFTRENVDVPSSDKIPNGVQTDDGPATALLIPGTSLGDLILVSNQQGSISMIPANSLRYEDMDSENKFLGLRLFSASNFENRGRFPGRGANHMTESPATGLVYISSPLNNQIYVLNPMNQTIEAMIDMDAIALPTIGMRTIAIDDSSGNEIAYIAHSGLDSIIVLDISNITVNNIPYEVIVPPIIDIIPAGDGPEDIKVVANGSRLFVSNQNEDSIYMIDTTLRQAVNKVYLDKPKGPGRLLLDEASNRLYSLDFFSNTISYYNATTGNRIGTIQ